MIITCLGHAEFLLELENGMNIVIDPFDASCGYPVHRVKADAVLVSHGHHDHCAVENVDGYTQVIAEPGTYTLAPDVTVTAVPAWHDDAQGEKRGRTLLFLIEAEGLRIAHMGDLGHLLLDVAVILDVDAALCDQGGNGLGVFGISLGHGQADIGPFHSTSLLFVSWGVSEKSKI